MNDEQLLMDIFRIILTNCSVLTERPQSDAQFWIHGMWRRNELFQISVINHNDSFKADCVIRKQS